ncbi:MULTISPECIES: hypothetical protein [unclassified Chryseobacterium]|uniref:hypothetical protein n=1 Tax=unclassified Chryseobacterium TaxID=2593645 RepID=UPI00100B287B|nr:MULTISPECIES: hypothetical protein [unclassified Chryseobacterium]RXM52690.1 hypothetical protein BOQ64_07525 [Chryseobacterium sp. CH25]RXM66745.1 hypothetical protein BOQ60_02005 [Chryseobacterium sp. CH1]
MNFKIFGLISSLLILYSCGFGKTEWRIDQLYTQKIEGTSKVIYYFSAWGGLDSNPHGFIILDSTKQFQVEVESILPIYQLSQIPNKSNIEGITHECYGTCGDPYYNSIPIFKPMKVNISSENEIKLTTRTYQYKGYSEHDRALERYVFEKYKETKDSLFFYNLNDVESMNGIHLDELKVKKGETYLLFNKQDNIEKIIVDDVTLNLKTNSIEKIRHIALTPKNKIRNKEFSERGIFRELKNKNRQN